jgi:hypothetical protein
MKRGAPMKRTPFARPTLRSIRIEVIAESGISVEGFFTPADGFVESRRTLQPIRQVAPFTLAEPVQTPKHEYIRSPALMKAYRLLPCQHCGANDGTIYGAHANLGLFGKGGAIKADDNRAASLCMVCHYELDQGHLWSYEERRSIWVNAHAKTVNLLVLRGLWPAGVPVPETAELLKDWSIA